MLSADYQQAKLIPKWGRSEQPGSSYYLQKVSIEVFGIVDHRNDEKFVYLFDEQIGPKNTDHTISLLAAAIQRIQDRHPWISWICIFMDNATSTNKNRFLFRGCHRQPYIVFIIYIYIYNVFLRVTVTMNLY